MNAYYALDMDRMQLEADEARAEYHRERAAEEPVTGCGCPEWCSFYNVTLGIPMCGETFPRCELGRDLRGTK